MKRRNWNCAALYSKRKIFIPYLFGVTLFEWYLRAAILSMMAETQTWDEARRHC